MSAPRQKLLLAAVTLLLLPLFAVLQGSSGTTMARVVLALAAVIGLLGWWWKQAGPGASGFKATPRMQVVQRVGLSPRTGLALVEIDGRAFVVVHGEGFARIRPAPRPVRVRHPHHPPSVAPVETAALST